MRDKFAGSLIAMLDKQTQSDLPLARRIQNAIRGQIASGALRTRERLPSSRTLAAELGIARDTAEAAYQQLETQGFLSRVRGSGTFVADSVSTFSVPPLRQGFDNRGMLQLAERGNAVFRYAGVRDPRSRAFDAAMPDIRAFPCATWNRIASRVARSQPERVLDYSDPQGLPSLREEIARYLSTHRGVRCSPDNIIVLTSSQQGLSIIASLMIDAGDTVAVENPGYPGAKSALSMAGAKLLPITVDEHGLKTDSLIASGKKVRGVYITPSHQYPTGVTLSLERRLQILDWASRRHAFIIEDDYDSEYRYEGSPVACLQGLDRSASVLYVGTFTKTLFPAIRLAYLVVPRHLRDAFVTARTLIDGHSSYLYQATLAAFMSEGHFTAHIRRMRQLYRARRDSFVEEFEKYLGGYATFPSASGGFQIACHLNDKTMEASSRALAASIGIELPSLGKLYVDRPLRTGWIMGYVGLTPAEAQAAVRKLARALNSRRSR